MSDKSVFGITAIRTAAAKRSDETSLHLTADEIGMSYTGLRHFLAGGKPQPKTLTLLVEWYALSRRVGSTGDTNTDDVNAAVVLLKRYLNADGRKSLEATRADAIRTRLFGEDSD